MYDYSVAKEKLEKKVKQKQTQIARQYRQIQKKVSDLKKQEYRFKQRVVRSLGAELEGFFRKNPVINPAKALKELKRLQIYWKESCLDQLNQLKKIVPDPEFEAEQSIEEDEAVTPEIEGKKD